MNISEERLAKRARRRVARDHCDPIRYPSDLSETRVVRVTPLPADQCKVMDITYFDRVYLATPDHVGTIELTYSREGYRAIYGFTADGDLVLYAD